MSTVLLVLAVVTFGFATRIKDVLGFDTLALGLFLFALSFLL